MCAAGHPLSPQGVCVARKDFNAPKHPELEAVPNLMVIKSMQSLKSRGYVTEQFAWRHFYWALTNEGIEYLRTFLHLPEEVRTFFFGRRRNCVFGRRPADRIDFPDGTD